ncbi:MAG: hypothetical protein ACE5DK_10210 [Paracoccaceae bacterium]
MAGYGINAYSRFVAWTKIILPLMALAILSSLFLFSKSRNVADGISLLGSDYTDYTQKERVTGARFAGMTSKGIAIVLSADEASPRGSDGVFFDANIMRARVELKDGIKISIDAAHGEMNSVEKMATLDGGITLRTTDGYVARTSGLRFALSVLDIQSLGPVVADGPLGHVEAGYVAITTPENPPNPDKPGYVIVFKDGVKLVYTPPAKE